jgi:hypothetical protein
MSSWLKKNVSLVMALVFSAILVGGALFYKFSAPPTTAIALTTLSEGERVAIRAGLGAEDTDTDGDGLKDWEETVRKTDPNNPDTDGDGTADGEESALSRDPLKPGPNDTVDVYTGAGDDPYRSPETLSRTEALSRELFATYAQLGSAGAFDTARQTVELNNLIARNLSLPEPTTYSVSDVRVSKGTDGTAIPTYRKAALTILESGMTIKEYELFTLARLLETKDPQYQDILLEDAAVYETVVAKLLSVSVPQLLVPTHLSILNGLASFSQILNYMAENSGDPADLLLAIDRFSAAEQDLQQAMQDFHTLTK